MRKRLHRSRDAMERQRYQIVLALGEGQRPSELAAVLHCGRSTVYRVAARFIQEGIEGLRDRRHEALPRKVTREIVETVWKLVEENPRDRGWARSTWTCELIQRELEITRGIRLSRTHVHRTLGRLGYHYGRPRPVVICRDRSRASRLRAIERLLRTLPPSEVAFYEDEVDIHLNPKIGAMWMRRGQQREVVTPGQNQKRYIAGARHTRTGQLVFVEAMRKNSDLFVALLHELCRRFRRYRRVHVILDNYGIHHSKKTLGAVQALRGRIVLHFLPTYSPNENPIERVWEDLHANVTRNHQFPTMDRLMEAVRHFLTFVRSAKATRRSGLKAAA
jgi:transposase